PAERRGEPDAALIRSLSSADLRPGPWGSGASLTTVGPSRSMSVDRLGALSPDAPLATQVKDAVRVLLDRGAMVRRDADAAPPLPSTGGPAGVVAVLAEADQELLTRELCGLAARLASDVGGSTVLLAAHHIDAGLAGSWGA